MDASTFVGTGQDGPQQLQSLLAFPFENSLPLAEALGPGSFKIRAAGSWGARRSASFLVNRLYTSRGYKSSAVPQADSPHRLTLVASDQDVIVGTLTVGFDAEEPLLADDLFRNELDALRDTGRQLCEFTKLALDGIAHSQRVLAAMFHVAFIHAHRIRGCDNLLIEVNPRHVRYYEGKLGFSAIGPVRTNRRVNAPAVLLSLDLWHAQAQILRFGGKPELCATERSLYPFGFSASEESGIVSRLLGHRNGGEASPKS